MKILLSMVCMLVATQAAADGADPSSLRQLRMLAAQNQYSQELDIVRVISHSGIPEVCSVVPTEMVYEDSKGTRHVLRYHVMGNGCLG